MNDLRRDVTIQSIEHRERSHNVEHVTSHTQWRYDNFSLYARSYEHNSYDYYEGNRVRNYYNDRSYERAPRNEVGNGGNYVRMDERIQKRKGDVERYYDSYDHYVYNYGSENMYEHNDTYSYRGYNYIKMRLKPIKTWSLMKQALRIRCGVKNHDGQGQV
ncbi:hypothetical protein M9H77_13052 [Catharanthus roseus]|uniref:Uncharacterized protein n=1 Tax=Catharanthus roseus TaxID=4058 RepID=A0ACC0BJA8_CATRO|nr:hypothetical protein M9H77_13052 [Catharanthus roseus]